MLLVIVDFVYLPCGCCLFLLLVLLLCCLRFRLHCRFCWFLFTLAMSVFVGNVCFCWQCLLTFAMFVYDDNVFYVGNNFYVGNVCFLWECFLCWKTLYLLTLFVYLGNVCFCWQCLFMLIVINNVFCTLVSPSTSHVVAVCG